MEETFPNKAPFQLVVSFLKIDLYRHKAFSPSGFTDGVNQLLDSYGIVSPLPSWNKSNLHCAHRVP